MSDMANTIVQNINKTTGVPALRETDPRLTDYDCCNKLIKIATKV
jgi:hypothetical protein